MVMKGGRKLARVDDRTFELECGLGIGLRRTGRSAVLLDASALGWPLVIGGSLIVGASLLAARQGG